MTATTPPPLTTTFVPPASCTTDTYLIENLSGTDYPAWTTVTTGQTGWWLHLGPTEWSSCFPSGFATSTEFYFSPGVCPSGYWTAYQTANTSEGSMAETSATCCPINYKVQTESRLAWFTTNQCTSRLNALSVWTFTQGSTVSSSTTTADGINARGISIRWRASDRVSPTDLVSQTSVSQTSTSIAPSTMVSSTVSNTALSTTTNTSQSTTLAAAGHIGLSTGAKAGIGVGAAIGALLLIAGGIFLGIWLHKRKRSQASSSDSGSALYPRKQRHLVELESRQPELEASQASYKYAEADGYGQPRGKAAELPAR